MSASRPRGMTAPLRIAARAATVIPAEAGARTEVTLLAQEAARARNVVPGEARHQAVIGGEGADPTGTPACRPSSTATPRLERVMPPSRLRAAAGAAGASSARSAARYTSPMPPAPRNRGVARRLAGKAQATGLLSEEVLTSPSSSKPGPPRRTGSALATPRPDSDKSMPRPIAFWCYSR